MLHITLAEDKRDGKDQFKLFDMAVYAKKMFGMFGGTEVNVKLECKNELIGVIIDRFGKDTMIIPSDGEHFRINVDVEVSQQFLAWIIGLGEGVKVLSPEHVVEMMRAEAKRLMEQYK